MASVDSQPQVAGQGLHAVGSSAPRQHLRAKIKAAIITSLSKESVASERARAELRPTAWKSLHVRIQLRQSANNRSGLSSTVAFSVPIYLPLSMTQIPRCNSYINIDFNLYPLCATLCRKPFFSRGILPTCTPDSRSCLFTYLGAYICTRLFIISRPIHSSPLCSIVLFLLRSKLSKETSFL